MLSAELSGLVLTHGDRDPSGTIVQLSGLCDQVVVVVDTRDGGSLDTPLDDMRDSSELTVIERPFDTFPSQRNAGLDQVSSTWTLVVDSDEHISPGLAAEIVGLDPPVGAAVFTLPRREVIRGKTLSTKLDGPHPRLFRSDQRYSPTPVVHERLVGFGQTGDVLPLTGDLVHLHGDNTSALWRRYFAYGRAEATHGGGTDSFSWLRVAGTSASHVVRQGYLRDGLRGMRISGAVTAYRAGTKFPHRRAAT